MRGRRWWWRRQRQNLAGGFDLLVRDCLHSVAVEVHAVAVRWLGGRHNGVCESTI